MEGIIKHNPELHCEAEVQAGTIYLANGTMVTAISGDYQGAAGSNHGFVSYDELWGYTSEASTRLWEELTPVPTRKNSIRFISTYAGFEGESERLWDLYKQVVSKGEHPEGQGERLHPDLPIFGNREARLFAYWDHEPRMAWQTQEYYRSQKKTLRPGTYLCLHENKWATAEETFITPEMWDPCVNQSHRPSTIEREPLFVGVDTGIKHDNAARVAVKWDEAGEGLTLVSHRIWKPSPGAPLDLESTIEQDLRDLSERGDVVEALADPYQMVRSIPTFQSAGVPIREFPQTQANFTLMGQTLFDLLAGKNLDIYPSDELRQQALSTVAVGTPRGWRIAKEKTSKKIDAIVALSMACVAAMAHRGELGSRAARGFKQSAHVTQDAIAPSRGPVYIGQTFDIPATVIAQADHGAVTVLAAFANEQMSLRRHVETIVKPWRAANCPWVFQDRRLLVGIVEALDTDAQCDFVQTLNGNLGGSWDPACHPWETRKDSMLDIFGKVQPFTMKPALQISRTDARLLVEALSGRWTYEQERRDRRGVWHYLASAFSLVIDRIDPSAAATLPEFKAVWGNADPRRVQRRIQAWRGA